MSRESAAERLRAFLTVWFVVDSEPTPDLKLVYRDMGLDLEIAWQHSVKKILDGCVELATRTNGDFHLLLEKIPQRIPAAGGDVDALALAWPKEQASGPVDSPVGPRLIAANYPFVNRTALVDTLPLLLAAGAGKRVLLLDGGSASGKSYTKFYLDEVGIPYREWNLVQFTDGVSGAQRFLDELCDKLGIDRVRFAESDTTASASLMSLKNGLRELPPDTPMHWVFLESAGQPLSQELGLALKAVVESIATLSCPVRLVLAGFPSSCRPDLKFRVHHEALDGLHHSHVVEWIDALRAQYGVTDKQAEVDAELASLFPDPGQRSPVDEPHMRLYTIMHLLGAL